MRIIAGAFRRRVLKTPPDGSVTRPIPDRVKESLFQLLRGHYEGATVFDAFAGTGAIGLEAVSRGAVKCVLVEKDRRIAEILRSNVEMLRCEDRCEVLVADALGPAALARAPRPLHLAFLDPPYPLVRDRSGFERVKAQMEKLVNLLDDTGFIVLRTPWPLRFEVETGQAHEGETQITEKVFKKKSNERVEWKREQQRRERDEARGRAGQSGKDAGNGAGRGAGKRAGAAGSPNPRNLDDQLHERVDDGVDDEIDDELLDEELDALEMDEDEIAEDDDSDHHDDFAPGDREESAYMSPEEMNELLAAEAADAAAIEAASGRQWEDADLSLRGADGPETHVYHGMAVHLYCRKK